ncbi:DUF4367 domain-containing protein [Paenibacillus profundus]|uniref:DUF4367 domain-containing protein n=1 Tax=Paenibacillus profundus TaxID=1173085 RepID=A0ABS8YK50_9BACL|nr:DUF4367 domain-containing protein [Paenibacillus profundus]MCE5170950.1 DUF4367 domain-containing protein [Paenibacillus profundus]
MKNTMKLTITTLCSILLLGSMSTAVQAAPSQPFSSIALKTAAAKAPTDAEKKKMIEAEKKRIVQIKKNPGDVYLLYVSDKKLNGGSEFLYYVEFPKFKKYEEYEKWTSKLKGAIVQEPEGMPEGYTFVKGEVQSPFSKQFEAQVKAEAKGKVVYSKKMEWTEAGEIKLEYKKGKNNIIFHMQTDYTEDKETKEYRYESAADSLNTDRNQLTWSEKGKMFYISTNPENPLTKEELIELAKTMIKK